MAKIQFVLILMLAFWISSCGDFVQTQSFSQPSLQKEPDLVTQPAPPPAAPSEKVNFCSQLDLDEIVWPELDPLKIDMFGLAMNITSSFEGKQTWGNITNNFDGQGISLGLFQQNLGQGSLQELLLITREEEPKIFDLYFSKNQKSSLFSMLDQWDIGLTLQKLQPIPSTSSLDEVYGNYSPLDRPIVSQKASNSKNQNSVDWALTNLYLSDQKTFVSSWKNAFQKIASHPFYISMQVFAADKINQKALRLFKEYEAKELRSYLFFFDIVVQNGGIPKKIKDLYLQEIKDNDRLSENERLKILLKHRLTIVREQYIEDVRSRKESLLDGFGLVHRTNRNFIKEYCVQNWTQTVE